MAAGPRQFANKFAPTPCGQNQEWTCVSRMIRLLPRVLRLVPGLSDTLCAEPGNGASARRAGASLLANCREPTVKPSRTVHQAQPRSLVWLPVPAVREQARSHALRAESRAGLRIAHDQAASKHFAAGAGGVAILSARARKWRFCPEGVGASLLANCREPTVKPSRAVHQAQPRSLVWLPVPGSSRTSSLLRPAGRIKSGLAINVFANKLAPTPCGQNQERACVSRMIRSSRRRSTSRIRLFPGVCRAFLDSLLDRTLAVVFGAAGEEPDGKVASDTASRIRLATALISGFTPRRTAENTSIGKVVEPGPETKLASTSRPATARRTSCPRLPAMARSSGW